MDQCQYCREFHASHEVCDGFIDAVEKGDVEMIVVKVELWSDGQEHKRLGEMVIYNDGTNKGSPVEGNYVAEVSGVDGHRKKIRLVRHKRARGFWRLIYRACSAMEV